MKDLNIPIYRAKKLTSDEYVEGSYCDGNIIDIDYEGFQTWTEIDTTTLAIHFPDMLDSEDNKIFASLNEDGRGGDFGSCESGIKHLLIFDGFKVVGINTDFHGAFKGTKHNNINKDFIKNTQWKVVGIQK